MCLNCKTIIQESLSAEDFWRNYRELLMVDQDHAMNMINELANTSDKYQEELSGYGLTSDSVIRLRES